MVIKNTSDNDIDPSSIAVAMITHYPHWYRGKLRSIKNSDKIRGDLALETIQKAKKIGHEVIVADGESAKTFRKELGKIEGIYLIKRRSMKRRFAKRQTIKKASKLADVQVIIVTEPEKVSLITDCITSLVQPILENKSDIVLPKRNPELFKKTYPSYQFDSETEGNILYNEILRAHGLIEANAENFDIFFGPFALKNSKNVLSLFMKNYPFKVKISARAHQFFQEDEYGFIPTVYALKKGLEVKSVEVPFSYPNKQKQNETTGVKELFITKRRNQKMSILIDLLYFTHYLD